MMIMIKNYPCDIPFPDAVERSLIQQAISRTFQSTAHLAKRLPTGTLMELLPPILTNQGECDYATRAMTSALIALCRLSSFLLSFSDSFKDKNGNIFHGFATFRGFWLIDGSAKLSPHVAANFRLQFIDFAHAFMAILVFATVALFDKNTELAWFLQATKEVSKTNVLGTTAAAGISQHCYAKPNKLA
ncbi:hypothetical protein Cgig2_026982 [Carnegiea gigantea]|uniref:Uncharacterized protein n=1 Tax=Carnegiea gigantea TaxID=171969 RepID=A0A9Q1GM95_9CARY|nr:hypothetical protein Cgig2_026982 [Carnegiea gigantea]